MAALLDLLVPQLWVQGILLVLVVVLLLDQLLRLDQVDESFELVQVLLPDFVFLFL